MRVAAVQVCLATRVIFAELLHRKVPLAEPEGTILETARENDVGEFLDLLRTVASAA